MEELDFKDKRVLDLLRIELDRREKEVQQQCSHLVSGTMQQDRTIICDACGKTMSQYDVDNAFAGDMTVFSTVEQQQKDYK